MMAALPAFIINAGEPPVKKNISLTPTQRKMCDRNTDFACNLFRTVTKSKQGNSSTILSPVSVSYLLGMLNEGADGNTRQQISDVLGLGDDVLETNKYFKKLIDEAPLVDAKATVKIANLITVNSARGINLIQQYQYDMQKYYKAKADALDFGSGNSLDYINNWCNSHTNGMIPSILNRLDMEACMYLLNAVYFKASWTHKFDPEATRDRTFTKQNGSTVMLPMMHRKGNASYGENGLYKMLCMPYGSNGYSMYVLLPHNGNTIDDIIQDLSAQTLKEEQHEMSNREVDILMPRFTTTSETYLEDALSSMGMPLTFNKMLAEFPNMANCSDLYVSMMKQRAKIEVNEEGTKAAAVTVSAMTNRSMSIGSICTFHATKPFVYYIVENSTGTIFFMGTYCGD